MHRSGTKHLIRSTRMETALAVLLAAAALGAVAVVLWETRRQLSPPPLPPPAPPVRVADELAPIVELIGQTVAQTAEAIGKAVSAAQFAPPEPLSARPLRVLAPDPDIQAGDVDFSDPTDRGWLHPNRPDVSFEEPPGGWPA